ncbi:MAG: peptidoglycan synthetase [Bacteroidia bacterium]|nr:peptidoglycan synthetase [Bacteroidia bacterium]
MNIHFIAIGGSAMHNLAIALQEKGYHVTGSDDEIFEPSKSRLAARGLLPLTEGWVPERITNQLDAVILGMHAKADNPELIRAKELDVKIFSYPEYLYEQSKEKKRIVIGGSHGKTTITAMILHVLDKTGIDCDYMVGAQLEGFDVMVRLTEEAPYIIFEGDEYLTSPLDRRPKFHLYKPDIALLSGVAWDHINVFPTFENYLEQFIQFIRLIEPKGTLIFCREDAELNRICQDTRDDIKVIPYELPDYKIEQGTTWLETGKKRYPLHIFGHHNLLNLNGARCVCEQLGISNETFDEAISSFRGASKRLELVSENDSFTVYKDFAHAPSKVKVTIGAIKKQYPNRKIIACLELHTYSSLSEGFLHHYAGTMDEADLAIVYYNPHTIELKRLPQITPDQIKTGFARSDLEVLNDSKKLHEKLLEELKENSVFLFMSSGDFDGLNLSSYSSKSETPRSNP